VLDEISHHCCSRIALHAIDLVKYEKIELVGSRLSKIQ